MEAEKDIYFDLSFIDHYFTNSNLIHHNHNAMPIIIIKSPLHSHLNILHGMRQFDFRRYQIKCRRNKFTAWTIAAIDPAEISQFTLALGTIELALGELAHLGHPGDGLDEHNFFAPLVFSLRRPVAAVNGGDADLLGYFFDEGCNGDGVYGQLIITVGGFCLGFCSTRSGIRTVYSRVGDYVALGCNNATAFLATVDDGLWLGLCQAGVGFYQVHTALWKNFCCGK